MHKIVLAALLMLAALAIAPAGSGNIVTLLPRSVGEHVHVRVTRAEQTLNAPRIAAEDLDLELKPNDLLLLTRNSGAGTPDLSVLRIAADGSLQVSEAERGAPAGDADLMGILQGLNLALATIRNAGTMQPSWNATLAIPSMAQGPATTVVVPIAAVNTAGGNVFDLRGDAQVAAASGAPARSDAGDGSTGSSRQGGGARGGGIGGGGFPGGIGLGGFPGSSRRTAGGGSNAAGGGSRPMTLLVTVEGHVGAGRLQRIVIAQTRVLTVDGAPFTNLTSWTIEVPG